jgi:UDP-N-acetylglucosamine 4,6-dehydratase
MWLITGGTGSFGQAFTEYILHHTSDDIAVYSRDEHKQHDMAQRFNSDRLRFFVGDVRDKTRLLACMATRGKLRVVHAAALKHVATGQQHVREVYKTNVEGTANVVDAVNHWGGSMVLLSTDKAVQPVNYYGASKMLAEGIVLQGGQRVARWGNVFGSRGSVLHHFREAVANGHTFRITHPDMTRFVITLDQAVQVTLDAIEKPPGSVTVPTLPAMRITDLARAFDDDAEFEEIGVQDGEKIAEALAPGVTSDGARMLTVEEIRGLIDAHV